MGRPARPCRTTGVPTFGPLLNVPRTDPRRRSAGRVAHPGRALGTSRPRSTPTGVSLFVEPPVQGVLGQAEVDADTKADPQ